MLAILPLMRRKNSFFSAEGCLKYFIAQSIASILFLFFSTVAISFAPLAVKFFLGAAIFFKLGVPPFHSWLVRILLTSSYKIMFMLAVVQKFIPLHILTNMGAWEIFVFPVSLISLIVIFFWLPGLASLRVCLIVSTWGNSIWLIAAAARTRAWVIFLIFYGSLLASALHLLHSTGIQKLSSVIYQAAGVKLLCLVRFLGLAGVPPIAGFFVKLTLLKLFIPLFSVAYLFFLLNISLLVLYAYLAIFYYFLGSHSGQTPLLNFQSTWSSARGVIVFRLALPLFLLISV